MSNEAFSGRQRKRTTRLSVRVGEVVSKAVITTGGIGTILSVVLMLVFLVAVVIPLFSGSSVEASGVVDVTTARPAIERFSVDEYRVLAMTVDEAGTLELRRLDTGELLRVDSLFGEETPTCQSWAVDGSCAVFGFADGSARVVTFSFVPRFLDDSEVAPELRTLGDGELATLGQGIVQRTPEGQLRQLFLAFEVKEPVDVCAEPLARVDLALSGSQAVVGALTEGGALFVVDLSERRHMITDEVFYSAVKSELPYEAPRPDPPSYLLVAGLGDQVVLAWEEGDAIRIDARDREASSVAEVIDFVPTPGERITALSFLLGRTTLLVGDSLGTIGVWFTTKPDGVQTVDGSELVLARELGGPKGAVVRSISPSSRSRMLAAGYSDGSLRLFQATVGKQLASVSLEGEPSLDVLNFCPKEDGLAALAGGRLHRFELDPRHTESSLHALFGAVWYEGYPEPQHVWQSSSGTDDFEPKLGLMPLVFGTLKATFYSMLFGAPIALLAAIYTSEFMSRRYRTPVKSTIEIMASLPSVVLGFLAALVIAPYVQRFLPATLAIALTLPLCLLLGAYVWQMVPRRITLRMEGLPRLIAIAAAIAVSVFAAWLVGPFVERLLFGGNLELWLDGEDGSALGGWVLLTLPLAALAVALFSGTFVAPWFRLKTAGWGHTACAQASFIKFLLSIVATVALAVLVGAGLSSVGLDPRADLFGVLGTYVQRNALVVGFVMGFAIIPIIYTLAEDALSSVPEHLRLASLGAGATQWQTAMRVVVPTAMSGLFSALMIGLGRAVGETMIVLMATGNTPVMDLNIFNGFRTLSANIAVELPEAVQGSTHYRTLFLAALVLFAMTFVLNTLAELIRQRFRRRFHNL
ncbi:MAG: ABC transporter permease subunit [Planctomycetota bacterium]